MWRSWPLRQKQHCSHDTVSMTVPAGRVLVSLASSFFHPPCPMSYSLHESPECVTLVPAGAPVASVIWLHGLGADGHDFVPIVQELRLPPPLSVRFIFPHARARPVTVNNGFVMRAWYDIKSLGRMGPEDAEGIHESAAVVERYIEQEAAFGIAPSRVIVAGFSQGGAIALQAGLRYPQRLAGVLALSTYLP